jgi:integrase
MPKRVKQISARALDALKDDGKYAVGGVAGLYLHIRGASRCWMLRIVVEGRRCEFGLGSYPEVSLALARDRAWARRRAYRASDFVEGLPAPQEIQKDTARPNARSEPSKREEKTFALCATTYIAAQTPGWKSGKHAKQWTSSLERYAYPVIGKLNVSAIDNDHLLQILRPMWATKTETATRLRGRIECILDWAAHRGYRARKNPAQWEGNLKHELPSPTRLKKRKKQHFPALPYLRVGAFMADLRRREGASIRALEWGILTAARSQEIRGARHSEVDVRLKRWTIPAARMKAEKDHVVPLSSAAIRLYESLPVVEGRDLLFPALEGGELCDAALGQLISGMHDADIRQGGSGYLDPVQNRIATAHGFRSTFRDWAAEVASFPREVIEHALAHKLKDEAEAAYQRGMLLMKRAALMEEWARFCSEETPRLPALDEIVERRVA